MATKRKKLSLSKKASDLINQFAEDAIHLEWSRDKATNKEAKGAKGAFEESKDKLRRYILSLQQRLRKIKADRETMCMNRPNITDP
jgi:ATP-dependent exoDNAse (exonuclease V) alpha subunit